MGYHSLGSFLVPDLLRSTLLMSSFSLKIGIDKRRAGRRLPFIAKLPPNKSKTLLKHVYCRIKWDQYVRLRLKTDLC